jgi:hypothetical protein
MQRTRPVHFATAVPVAANGDPGSPDTRITGDLIIQRGDTI